jgi:hypothetical protein
LLFPAENQDSDFYFSPSPGHFREIKALLSPQAKANVKRSKPLNSQNWADINQISPQISQFQANFSQKWGFYPLDKGQKCILKWVAVFFFQGWRQGGGF